MGFPSGYDGGISIIQGLTRMSNVVPSRTVYCFSEVRPTTFGGDEEMHLLLLLSSSSSYIQ